MDYKTCISMCQYVSKMLMLTMVFMHMWHIICIFDIMQKGGFIMLEINTKAPSFNLPDE